VATAARTDTTFAKQKQAAALLNPLFARHSDHPGLAHYIIHANDSPQLAQLGLDAARRYASIAPSAPHAQHMPSHIFVRLGMWDETIASNWKSYQAGVDYAKAQKLPGVQSHEFHALDYAVYGYLQRGQDRAARGVVALGDSISSARTMNTLVGGYNRVASAARIPLERGDWAAAAAFPAYPSDVPVVAALAHFTRGIGAARSGKAVRAAEEGASLDMIAEALEKRDPYWSRVVGIKARLVEAWAMFATGDTAGGLAIVKQAADLEDVTEKHPVTPGELLPARELEADMHLAAGHYAAARAAYQATLVREPGRARSLYGLARAAERAGDKAGAAAAYRDFLKMMEQADGDRVEIAAARKAVAGS
jgi:tetratricopeptide (TPR) repeat protein